MPSQTFCKLSRALSEHEPWLRTSLFARMGNREEVEEVMQEVAVAVANQAGKSEAIERAAPWLYRVAMRQMMQFRRKAGRRKKLIARVAQDKPPAEEEFRAKEPLDFLIGEERRNDVRKALVSMSELDRQLLLLKYVDGLSYGEIAKRVGVSASAVQSRLHRARAAMRRRLVEDD